MEADSGIELTTIKVDGGAVANDFLMQFQADIVGVPVHRPEVIETTALGAAYLAGLAVGFWDSKEAVVDSWALGKEFRPMMPEEDRKAAYEGWLAAVERTKS